MLQGKLKLSFTKAGRTGEGEGDISVSDVCGVLRRLGEDECDSAKLLLHCAAESDHALDHGARTRALGGHLHHGARVLAKGSRDGWREGEREGGERGREWERGREEVGAQYGRACDFGWREGWDGGKGTVEEGMG